MCMIIAMAIRALALALALTGCNELLGLHETVPGANSGPEKHGCPAIGMGPPVFSSVITDLPLDQSCHHYTASEPAKLGAAECTSGPLLMTFEGPIDAAVTQSTFTPMTPNVSYGFPALAPEGDHLIVRQYAGTTTNRFSWFVRDGSGWVWVSDILANPPSYTEVGTPSAGPDRRVLVAGDAGLAEYAEAPDGTWALHGMWSWTAFGIATRAYTVSLTADGLRAVFWMSSPKNVTYYMDRPTRDDAFSMPVEVPTAPSSSAGLFMLPDCSRLYFNSAAGVSYRYQVP